MKASEELRTSPGRDTVHVLVVDDQQPFRDAARAVIGHAAGFELVGEAGSGEEAIDMVDALTPDLVLMDINMGGIDGIEATVQITAGQTTPMVVLLSTYELSDLPPAARTSGAVAYVNKDDFGGRILRRLWQDAGDPVFTH